MFGRRPPAVQAAPPPPTPPTPAAARQMLARERCTHCGHYHSTMPACPRIKSITFTQNGTALSVKYWPHGQWPLDGLVHPDELAAIIEAEGTSVE